MYDIILIYGRPKTGKTKLGKLIATLIGAALADFDDDNETRRVLAAHLAYPTKPLVMTMMESKVVDELFPRGSPFVMMLMDMAIHMPNLKVVKDRHSG